MSGASGRDLREEWSILQNQRDGYEKYSLIIKLVNIVLLTAAYLSSSVDIVVGVILLILWVQDAIWKTYQSRIERRLLQLEDYLLNDNDIDMKAYQFNSDYHNNRPGSAKLINEYFRQAIRPTVAFPHIVLVFMSGLLLI